MSLKPLEILVAEDNLVNQKVIQAILEKLGHNLQIVGNGAEAIKTLALKNFDLILMDCQMPEMDGYEATRLIRSNTTESSSNIPIIAVTANAMASDKEKCLSIGMNDYLTKPIKIAELQEAILKATQKLVAN